MLQKLILVYSVSCSVQLSWRGEGHAATSTGEAIQ
jgi:hypothetical protein